MSADKYTYNNLNELTGISPGGTTRFEGNSNKALKSATVDSNPADLPTTQSFSGPANLASGANNIAVAITDGSNTTKTNNYQVSTKGTLSTTLTYDANGNLTSDGTNSFLWDAENRLIKIVYPGSNNYSLLSYDPVSEVAKVTKIVSGSASSESQFIWAGNFRAEARDGSGGVTIEDGPQKLDH